MHHARPIPRAIRQELDALNDLVDQGRTQVVIDVDSLAPVEIRIIDYATSYLKQKPVSVQISYVACGKERTLTYEEFCAMMKSCIE
jgi:hypothetical protein